MRYCRKCGAGFGSWVTVDGKPRNITRRKYCLDCSPFGGHNTRVLTEREEKRRTLSKRSVSKHRQKRKALVVEIFGGKCVSCGYDRCLAALDFHHREPGEKDPTIRSGNGVSLDRMIAELRKCILVCANCHREIHASLIDISLLSVPDPIIPDVKEHVVALNGRLRKMCVDCGQPTGGVRCPACSQKRARKVERPSAAELEQLAETVSVREIARRFGVCDKTIRGWAKSCGVKLKPWVWKRNQNAV